MSELFTIYGVSVVAITMALTQIIKQYIPEKIVPLIPLVVGVIVVSLSVWDIGVEYILNGLVVGLAAMGVFKIDHEVTNIGGAVYSIVTALRIVKK